MLHFCHSAGVCAESNFDSRAFWLHQPEDTPNTCLTSAHDYVCMPLFDDPSHSMGPLKFGFRDCGAVVQCVSRSLLLNMREILGDNNMAFSTSTVTGRVVPWSCPVKQPLISFRAYPPLATTATCTTTNGKQRIYPAHHTEPLIQRTIAFAIRIRDPVGADGRAQTSFILATHTTQKTAKEEQPLRK